MNWTEEYLIPPISRAKLGIGVLKRHFKNLSELIPHAVWPHEEAAPPKSPLPLIQAPSSEVYEVCQRIYDASLEGIRNLEQKAFGLLSYITGLLAVLAFAYSQMGDLSGKVWFIVPLILFLVTFAISFRCLSVKSVQHIFVNDIHKFETAEYKATQADFCKVFLSAAIFNQVKADNIADMLTAARMLLAWGLGIFAMIATVLIVFNTGAVKVPNPTVIQQEQIEVLKGIQKSLDSIGSNIAASNDLTSRLDVLSAKVQLLEEQTEKDNAYRVRPATHDEGRSKQKRLK